MIWTFIALLFGSALVSNALTASSRLDPKPMHDQLSHITQHPRPQKPNISQPSIRIPILKPDDDFPRDIHIKGNCISPSGFQLPPTTNTIPPNPMASIAAPIEDSAPVHSRATSGSTPPIASTVRRARAPLASSRAQVAFTCAGARSGVDRRRRGRRKGKERVCERKTPSVEVRNDERIRTSRLRTDQHREADRSSATDERRVAQVQICAFHNCQRDREWFKQHSVFKRKWTAGACGTARPDVRCSDGAEETRNGWSRNGRARARSRCRLYISREGSKAVMAIGPPSTLTASETWCAGVAARGYRARS